jgi:environmental stress-induced protein Ves
MATFLTENDFTLMPWRNGGGFTTELFLIKDQSGKSPFLFRISQAKIEHSGPFSFFPGIDRTLLLIQGNGLRLDFSQTGPIFLYKDTPRLHFKGEDKVECTLIEGQCLDFNVMVNREWGTTQVTTRYQKPKESYDYLSNNQMFLYLNQETPKLIALAPNEKYHLTSDQDLNIIEIVLTPKDGESRHTAIA